MENVENVHSVDNLLHEQIKQLNLDREEVEFLIKESNSTHIKNMLNDYNLNLKQILKDTETKYNQHSINVDDKEDFISITKYSWLDSEKNVKIYVTDLFKESEKEKINLNQIKSSFNSSFFDIKIYKINGKNYRFNIKDLYTNYDKEKSSSKI